MPSKKEEELKRERMYDPVLKWKHLQETIAWAEANLPPEKRRNTPQGAKRKEEKLLNGLRNRAQ
jgi:hypothetical protein